MRAGDVVDGRFELERPAGSGGMGEVFRARDRGSGTLVAVKVVRDNGPSPRDERFLREAGVLAELSHPAIVRYVAHGATDSGTPYLVMEWLEGEDLMVRLHRDVRLSVEETITLGRRVAEALSVAHTRGIVHRDLKPSNLFLVDQRIERVKVLDFGIAQLGGVVRLTQTGTTVGTPGYMAPEQARSREQLTPQADVFSLGAVLYECLTGTPAFVGEHMMAVLAKVLCDEPPRVHELRPEVPRELDALIARMLAKNPDERPSNGDAVARALAALSTPMTGEALESAGSALENEGPSSLTKSERQLLSVVLVGHTEPFESAQTLTFDGTVALAVDPGLRREARAHGGRLELMADGSALVTIAGARIATDQAALAARCALALRAISPGRPVSLATGRGQLLGRLPVGDAVDRAAGALARQARATAKLPRLSDPLPIAIDEVTAGLLDGRFDVVESEVGLELRGEQEVSPATRTLLGKPTSCVGRDRELSMLEAIFDECVEEPVAQVIVVTGTTGMGKSRLAHELTRCVQQRHPSVEIWQGRGDPMRAGSALGLLGQALRDACGIKGGEPIEVRQEKLVARVKRHVPPSDQRRVAEFLGEFMGTPLPDEGRAMVLAARQDARLMGEQMQKAWEDFLSAECGGHPVLLVLEDLHWGDLPTVRFISAALRTLTSMPWMVLALARPEVHDTFPKLWADRGAQEIRLRELSPKAAKRLVSQVLGQRADTETIERLVSLADGNALYLEELIRAVAEGKGAALPETLLAMVHARLEALDGDARRVLRASSVFGEALWPDGVACLLGVGLGTRTLEWLQQLADKELLVRRPESRFPGEPEFAFRHALLREAAYAALTEGDRALGHRLAGEWLAGRGETDAMVLAEHFERGREPARAAAFYESAAEQAHRVSDTEAAIARAQRGLSCHPPDAIRVSLLGLLCEACTWRGDLQAAAEHADALLCLATPGTAPWVHAVSAKLQSTLMTGKADEHAAALRLLHEVEPQPEAVAGIAFALTGVVYTLDLVCQLDAAEQNLARQRAIVEPVSARDPVARGWMHAIHAIRSAHAHGDPWSGLRAAKASLESFMEIGHRRGAMSARMLLGVNFWHLGAFSEARRELSEIIAASEEFGLASSAVASTLAWVLIAQGELSEAHAVATRLIEAEQARGGLPLDQGRGQLALAEALLRLGNLEEAERAARAALDLLARVPLVQMAARAQLAAVLLAASRVDEALATAEEAMQSYAAMGAAGFRDVFARLIHAEALRAAGEIERAGAAIAASRERLLGQATRIDDAAMRRGFLENVPENARTLTLAREWVGER